MPATKLQKQPEPLAAEQALVGGLRRGEAAAQAELYRLYKPMLRAKATYLLGWRDPETEDVVQEAFAAAFQGAAGFEGRSKLSTWLTQICVNKAYDRLRQRKRRVLVEEGTLDGLFRAQALAAAPQAEEGLLAEERQRLLKDGLAKIGKACAELLGLRYADGLSFTEIKERLRQPLGTVTARLWRCQEQLKKLVKRE